MALATPLGSLAAFVEPSAEVAVPAIAMLAGIAGAWLQTARPPAAAHEHELRPRGPVDRVRFAS